MNPDDKSPATAPTPLPQEPAKEYVRPTITFRGDVTEVTQGLADAGGDTGFSFAS